MLVAGGGIASVRHDVAPCIGASGRGFARTGETQGQDPVVAVAWPAPVAPTLGTAWGDRHPGTNNQDFVSQSGGLFVPDAVEPLPFDTTQVTSVVNRSNPLPGDPCHPLTRFGDPPAVAFKASHFTRGKDGAPSEIVPPLSADADKGDQDTLVAAPTLTSANDPSRSPQSSEVTQQVAAVHAATMSVRRLTPRECERLQGFPDDWTAIVYRGKPASDGPRYKALGNSMAVNVMRWIGERVSAVDSQS